MNPLEPLNRLPEPLRVTLGTAREEGACNNCNANIGPHGTIDPNQAVIVVQMRFLSFRLCFPCARELSIELRGLLR